MVALSLPYSLRLEGEKSSAGGGGRLSQREREYQTEALPSRTLRGCPTWADVQTRTQILQHGLHAPLVACPAATAHLSAPLPTPAGFPRNLPHSADARTFCLMFSPFLPTEILYMSGQLSLQEAFPCPLLWEGLPVLPRSTWPRPGVPRVAAG